MRYYFLIILFLLIIFPKMGLAQSSISVQSVFDWSKTISQEINQKIVNPVKRTFESAPEGLKIKSQNLLKKVQTEKQTKQEEIKEEIKKGIKAELKRLGQKALSRFQELALNPLRDKIQRGSDWLRNQINQVRDYLKDIF